MANQINVAFAVNDPYVSHLCITIYSILRNNPNYKFRLYVLCEKLSEKSKSKIFEFHDLFNNVKIEVVELNDKDYDFSQFVIPENVSFISKETYFRYALPKVLKNASKVLYLDADLVVMGDIEKFYSENIASYYGAGIVDSGIDARFPEHKQKIGMKTTDLYINAGVFLMNLEKMRRDKITEKLIENTKKNKEKIKFVDQDIINLTLNGSIKIVDNIYNYTDEDMMSDKKDIGDVRIVHYTGGIKPWHNIIQDHTKKYVERYKQYEDEYCNLVMERQRPLVSLVVPVHNIEEDYLRECFESIKAQTYTNIEVIIVDDGSNKSTATFIDTYSKYLDGWEVIHQKNTGVNMARKSGFNKSKGQYIAFVDSDDELVETFCERLLQSAIKTDADTVIGERYSFNDDAANKPPAKYKQADDVLENKKDIVRAHRLVPFNMNSWGVAIWGSLYRREVIKKIDWNFANYTIAEDEFWTIQTKIFSEKVAYVHEQLYCYRVNITSRSKFIKQLYFKGNGENREVPFVSLGLEIFRKNTELFKKHKIIMLEEPLLYGISVTKKAISQSIAADKFRPEDSDLAKNIAKVFLEVIDSEKIKIDKIEIYDLKLIAMDPWLYMDYRQKIEEIQNENRRLHDEILLRDNELNLLRKPGVKLAARKFVGAIKRRLQRGVTGKVLQKIPKRQKLSPLEKYDRRYSKLKGIKNIRPSSKKNRYIVTLTSYGDRITNTAPRTIYSILSGKELPDKIILWLTHGENIPDSLKNLKRYGLEIKFTKDIKSFKKLIPALEEYPNDILITADDDVYYPSEWLAELKKAHRQAPDKIIANRADIIYFKQNGEVGDYKDFGHGQANHATRAFIPTGAGGVLYPPGSLNKNVLNEEDFTKLTEDNDDIWFWAMALLNDTDFALTSNLYGNIVTNPLISICYDSTELALWDSINSPHGKNQSTVALNNVLSKWPVIKAKLDSTQVP